MPPVAPLKMDIVYSRGDVVTDIDPDDPDTNAITDDSGTPLTDADGFILIDD